MMRYRLGALALLSSLFLFSVSATFAQSTSPSGSNSTTTQTGQEQEGSDDGTVSINFLTPGEETQGELAPGIGAVIYGFDGTAGDVVDVTMTQADDSLDPFLVLMGPYGEIIAYDDDSGEETFSSAINDATLPINGSYLIIASSFSHVDRNPDEDSAKSAREFTILVTGANAATDDPDYSETSAQIYSGDLTIGSSTEGYSNAEEPVFYYFLEASAGDKLNIVIDEADFDSLLMVFDQEGRRIGLNDDDPNGGLTSALRDFDIPEDGYYLVMVTALGFYSLDDTYTGGNFTISVESAK